jgi:hypothetical protein
MYQELQDIPEERYVEWVYANGLHWPPRISVTSGARSPSWCSDEEEEIAPRGYAYQTESESRRLSGSSRGRGSCTSDAERSERLTRNNSNASNEIAQSTEERMRESASDNETDRWVYRRPPMRYGPIRRIRRRLELRHWLAAHLHSFTLFSVYEFFAENLHQLDIPSHFHVRDAVDVFLLWILRYPSCERVEARYNVIVVV